MKRTLLTLSFLVLVLFSLAFEGMWIPSMLDAVHDDMKAKGLKLSKEEIYSLNNSSLKDGIVLFGGGCTGELVSKEGLLFTNHHCGFDFIQYHSSLEHDYLKDGFWAKNRSEELPCPGLTATFIVEMRDMTSEVLTQLKEIPDAKNNLASALNSIYANILNKAELPKNCKAVIRSFNYNTQYFMVVSKTYTDVRWVGAPPSCIGKFGGDTDNWVWPRHTGDFSVFRIYANEENEPADFSASNKPFQPKHFFPISLKGTQAGDFTMIYGFPGRTEHLLTSAGVKYNHEYLAPMRIEFRKKNLEVIDAAMRSSDQLRIQYAAKQSDVANAYKKWQGQVLGLNKFNAITLKEKEETQWSSIAKSKDMEASYQDLLERIHKMYLAPENLQVNLYLAAYTEFVFYGPEIFGMYQSLAEIINSPTILQDLKGNKFQSQSEEWMKAVRLIMKDFDKSTDCKRLLALAPIWEKYTKGVVHFEDRKLSREMAAQQWYNSSLVLDTAMVFDVLRNTNFISTKKLVKLKKKLEKDVLYNKSMELEKAYDTWIPLKKNINNTTETLMRDYTFFIQDLRGDKEKWADANSTLRLTYGQVEGSAPVDGMAYTPFTTSQGILDKFSTGNPDFDINTKLYELLSKKDFGKYGVNGLLPVCFTGSNHTTGGNSGSPALNGNGELIGINFDRTWESTMSDIYFNSEICRNVMVDSRYVLWVIEVYGGAGYLLDEMTLVK